MMTLIAEVFPKLRTPKNMVTSMSKKFRFKGSFGKQHGKRTQTSLKFACMAAPLPDLLMTANAIDLHKVSFSDV